MPEQKWKFESPFSPPVDPAYQRFENGWGKWVNDGGVFKNPTLRWHPRKGDWFVYPSPRWEMLDRGIPDLDPPAWVSGFTLPQLFRQVADTARRYPNYPNLVWNPHTGAWREARDTMSNTKPPPPPPPPPTPGPSVDAAKAKALVDRQREMNAAYGEYSKGAIDIVTLNQRMSEIRQRYKPLLG
jgi:hypothetical protein